MLGRPMLATATVLIASACTAPATEPDFDAPLPAARLLAIERAGAERDAAAVPWLVEQLESDDPAVRMLAAEALRRIEADAPDYWHGDAPPQRRAAIEAWVDHVSARSETTDPAAGQTVDDDG